MLHGLYIILGVVTTGIRTKAACRCGLLGLGKTYQVIKMLLTFLLVCVAWIFFRAKNVADAWYMVSHLCTGIPRFLMSVVDRRGLVGMNMEVFQPILIGHRAVEFGVAALFIMLLMTVEFAQGRGSIRLRLSRQPVWVRWGCYTLFMMSIMIFGSFDTAKQFIYFQF